MTLSPSTSQCGYHCHFQYRFNAAQHRNQR
uniref:Uncharacterized protein n=1 Tax=Anguilla anguilla TaxID=7936 RepID=A0A0E9UKV2_ANGAN